MNKEFSEISDENRAIYEATREIQALDALNTLYVAMTRSEKELHVISYDPKKQSDTYADLFVEFVNTNDLLMRGNHQHIIGDLSTNKAISTTDQPSKIIKMDRKPKRRCHVSKKQPIGDTRKKQGS